MITNDVRNSFWIYFSKVYENQCNYGQDYYNSLKLL